ncbi:MAG: 2-oxoacid:acceptor oxidoreductase family protein [Proteobacteria bacterium]|nr:2-oxoacid:acceptor oxidoreductase family protein [Pseudomonadota bacterium]
MHEIIWHGRGGQGVVVAAQILAEAAYIQGFKGVTSAPTFGPERRGAPLMASTRISDEPIRTFSQIESADIAVVLDESLMGIVDIGGNVKDGGLIIINTALSPEQIKIEGRFEIATVDATGIALKHNLTRGGALIINTPLLGAFAKASGLVSMENIEKGLVSKLSADAASLNFSAAKATFDETVIKKIG